MWLIGVSYKKHDLLASMVHSHSLDAHDLVFLLFLTFKPQSLAETPRTLRSGDFCDDNDDKTNYFTPLRMCQGKNHPARIIVPGVIPIYPKVLTDTLSYYHCVADLSTVCTDSLIFSLHANYCNWSITACW